MTDTQVTRRSGERFSLMWAVFSALAALGFASRAVRSLLSNELQIPFMAAIKAAENPYAFYGGVAAIVVIAVLCAIGAISYWQGRRKKG